MIELIKLEHEFSFRTREDDINKIDGTDFDVLVVGGGITGAGVSNLLAQNGIKTLLVERNDFASGTSSGSSKLIHGGLRYLANGEFREVKELLRERDYLVRNTDIVKPLKFHIILDQYSWKKYTLRLGLFLYNILDGKFKFPRFMPNDGRYPENVKGYFEYMDAYTDDSRLVIFNVVSAKRHGATCLNYVDAVSLDPSGEKCKAVLRDTVTGKEVNITSRIIVNAAGPWAGKVMKSMDLKLDAPFRLSKGIHVVLPASKIPIKEAIAFRTRIDRRQMFIIPRGEVVHVGTTDTFVNCPDDFTIKDSDIDYIISSVAGLFPDVSTSDVITAYSGLRPLFGQGNDPGKVSRDFEVRVEGNSVNLLGGKITNYRAAARKTAEKISHMLRVEIKTSGLPVVEYRRPEDGDGIEHIIFNECPLTLEDIMRRREAYRIYQLDRGKSKEEKVKREMEKAGMVVH